MEKSRHDTSAGVWFAVQEGRSALLHPNDEVQKDQIAFTFVARVREATSGDEPDLPGS